MYVLCAFRRMSCLGAFFSERLKLTAHSMIQPRFSLPLHGFIISYDVIMRRWATVERITLWWWMGVAQKI